MTSNPVTTESEWVIRIRFEAAEAAADALFDHVANDILDRMPTAVVGMSKEPEGHK